MKRKKVLIFLFLILSLTACTYPTKHIPCGDVFELVDAINKANLAGGIHTLELAQGCAYELTWIEDQTDGNNGLPSISTQISIDGNGATIIRDQNAPNFRIFHIGTGGLLTLNNLTIQNGHADGASSSYYETMAGAILNFGNLRIYSSIITENYAEGIVGGIVNFGSTQITHTTISHNNADHLTNGIINDGMMLIFNSTISGNGNLTYGDAIWNWGTLEIINSTISDNNGIGLENDDGKDSPGLVTLEYVTFSGNAAALHSVSGTITIRNTLFGPQQNVACGSGTTLITQGVNMDTDGTCNVTTVSPNSLKLGPLADNGGLTQTNFLGSGSVAINAATGDCPKTDQRNIHRPQGNACDVGAYESDDVFVQQAPTEQAPTEGCKYTASVNLFCRLGPSSSNYPEIDSFTPGQDGQVFGLSPDGNFAQVVGATNQLPCYVPLEKKFGALSGYCDDLPVLEPPPIPIVPDEPSDPPHDDKPVEGCTVRQAGGAIICVSPCPAGAAPGDDCTIP